MLKTEAISLILRSSGSDIARLYTPEMEVQVNVSQGDGKRTVEAGKIGRKTASYTDGIETWRPFRIPWGADSKPEYTDSELNYDLAAHVEGIGMSGWNWKSQHSHWVGYDFDSIANHSSGLSESILRDLKQKLINYPFAHLIKSTSGKGLHLYLFFDKPVPTSTHTEHAALARSMLSILSIEIGADLKSSIDVCGMILWVYHTKQEGTDGLSLIKKGEPFPTSKIPINWRDHLPVIEGKRKKIAIKGKELNEIVGTVPNFVMSERQQNIIKWVLNNGTRNSWWDSDHNMLVCHTKDLEECHKSLSLKGRFQTLSEGNDVTQNCFVFPSSMSSGEGFSVRRYGLGTKESPTWLTDDNGFTKCNFDTEPKYFETMSVYKGKENSKGEFVYENGKICLDALQDLDYTINIPDFMLHREFILKRKNDKIIMKFPRAEHDPPMDDFLDEKGMWTKVLTFSEEREEIETPDNLVRHVISDCAEEGWYVWIRENWVSQTKGNIGDVLRSRMLGLSDREITLMLGKCILDPWKLVNKPFEDEFPGDRTWNRDAATLAFDPAPGVCNTWYSLIEHIGSGLTESVQVNEWCNKNGIYTGADYLFTWIAWVFQRPYNPLPYLFLVGDQKCGKSSLHEAISLLFQAYKGYKRADQALKNESGFNSELRGAVLCVVEETNLSDNKLALNRIKDWVTGMTMSINTKGKAVYETENTTHWIQCANDAGHCPVFRGDTRIVVVHVDHLEQEIAKPLLMERLREEGPAFLHDIFEFNLPLPEGRLMLPVLETEEKMSMVEDRASCVDKFIREEGFNINGALTSFDEFYTYFRNWLVKNNPVKLDTWSKNYTARHLPPIGTIIKGRNMKADNAVYIGNFSFYEETPVTKTWSVREGKLVR